MTPSQKKWALILGSVAVVGTIGYFTKDKWMPMFKKDAPVAPTGKPPVLSSTGSGTAEKSNFSTDLNYPKTQKADLNYPKVNGVKRSYFIASSTLDNKLSSFDGGRFSMINITKKANGAGFNFQKVGFAGNSNLDNQPS